MKIAHITYHYQPIVGGQEVYVKNLIGILDKEGIRNEVYQPINKNYHYFSKRNHDNVKLVFNLPFLGRFFPVIGRYLFNFFLLLHYFAFFKYDRIIVHYAFHSLPFWFFKKKIIIISHGVEWYVDGKTINDKISHLIASITFNRFKIVANDTHYYRTFDLDVRPGKKYFVEVGKNKWFIPNCVDLDIFKPSESIKELINYNIIFVPRQITWDRGIHLAIESFYLFSEKRNDYILLIAGSVREKEYKKYCDSLVQKYNLGLKVIWLKKIDNLQMPKYYSSAKITLIPTIRREGTSLSALESMACGCPTISTNVAGLKDLPTVQVNPDPVEISAKMIECSSRLQELSRNQSEIVRNVFNYENWKNAWMNVINNTFEQKKDK